MKNPRRLAPAGVVEAVSYWLTNPGRRGIYDTYDYGYYAYYDDRHFSDHGKSLRRQKPGGRGDGGDQGRHGSGGVASAV